MKRALSERLKKWGMLLGMTLLFLLSVAHLQAQQIVDDLMAAGKYQEALKVINTQLAVKDDADLRLKMGQCHAELGQFQQAEEAFTTLAFDPTAGPEPKFELGKLFRRLGEYDKAIQWFMKFADSSPDSIRGFEWAIACDRANKMMDDSLGYVLSKLEGINGPGRDESPIGYQKGILFVSNGIKGGKKGNNAYADIYFSERAGNNLMGLPKKLKGKVNTKGDDGPISTDKRARQVFIGRKMDMKGGAIGFETMLVELENKGGKWSEAGWLDIVSKQSKAGHPALSPDGRHLVFAAILPGGYGGLDLYITDREGNEWGRPRNLGPAVNTAADEAYPGYSTSSVLWFSSNRLAGMGGWDFYRTIQGESGWEAAENPGFPLNSSGDEIGICFLGNSGNGYFGSSRQGGQGLTDIYGFKRFKTIVGKLVDSRTGKPLVGTRVDISDINQKKSTYFTDSKGEFRHHLRVGQDVYAKFFLKDYHDRAQAIEAREIAFDRDLRLEIPMEEIKRHMVLGKVQSRQSGEALQDAVVRVVSDKEVRIFTGKKGNYATELKPATLYRLICFKEGFMPEVKTFTSAPENDPQQLTFDFELKQSKFRYLEGRTIDIEREKVVPNAMIHILDENGIRDKETFQLSEDGMFYKVVPDRATVYLIASKEGYLPLRIEMPDSLAASDTILQDIPMVPLFPDKVYNTVYFEYRSSELNKEGRKVLQEVIVMLRDNPAIGIELNAHTDSRGGAEYNRTLSQERADMLADFIASHGIDRKRIRAKGFGESELFNNCDDSRYCKEELHAQNRRAEIKIQRLQDWEDLPEEQPQN